MRSASSARSWIPFCPEHAPRTYALHLQVETGSAITWKYPSVVLVGQDSVGEFYSVALTNNHQQVCSAGSCPADVVGLVRA